MVFNASQTAPSALQSGTGLKKATLQPIHPKGDSVTVLFNPEEYTLNKDINYAQIAIPGLQSPIVQFINGNMRTLEMELLVDTYEAKKDVRTETDKIFNLTRVQSETHAPPILQFTWGSLTFTCVLARVSQRFILFKDDGIPVRARLNVSFHEYIDPEHEAKEVNRQTADYSKIHVVQRGDTLASLAGRYYENTHLWRPIAIANDLDNPRRLFVGQELRIPALPFTDPNSGEVMR